MRHIPALALALYVEIFVNSLNPVFRPIKDGLNLRFRAPPIMRQGLPRSLVTSTTHGSTNPTLHKCRRHGTQLHERIETDVDYSTQRSRASNSSEAVHTPRRTFQSEGFGYRNVSGDPPDPSGTATEPSHMNRTLPTLKGEPPAAARSSTSTNRPRRSFKSRESQRSANTLNPACPHRSPRGGLT